MISKNTQIKSHATPVQSNINLMLGVLLCILFSGSSLAQISQGGQPLKSARVQDAIEWIDLEAVRVNELLLEDEWNTLTGMKNQRIAKEIQVAIRPGQQGNWSQYEDGTLVWKLGIRGKGAKGLGIVFNRYVLEKGTRIYLSDPLGENVLGAFTNKNNKPSGSLPVSYLPGDELIIQMEVPPETENFGELSIGSVRWAYLPVFDEKSALDKYFGLSGDCNVDINCALGDDWQIVKNSVVRLLNIEKCTGLLINNTREDNKAYVYTAAHCVFQNNKYQPTVFYFNYESPTCDGPDGSISNSISGATLIATGDTLENPRDADSLDFALLELSMAPPDSFKPYFAGWSRSKTPAQNTTAIHHPSGDVMKIAVDLDAPESTYHDIDYFPDLVRYSHWRVLEWDVATTEPGSSGCPLFNQDKLLVGTLTGGQATCSFQKNDYFTKFDYAWDYYSEPTKQLKHWLDPDNTGVMTLGGKAGWNVSAGRLSEAGDLSLYPNPASHALYVSAGKNPGKGRASGLKSGQDTRISIYRITGELVMQTDLIWQGQHCLDIHDLQPGIYLLRVSQNEQLISRRFIINR